MQAFPLSYTGIDMAQFVCPYAVRRRQYKFLMCRKQMEDGIDYNNTANALNAFCAHQRTCKCNNAVINSEGARECYKVQSAE